MDNYVDNHRIDIKTTKIYKKYHKTIKSSLSNNGEEYNIKLNTKNMKNI